MTEMITSGQCRRLKRLAEDALNETTITKREAQRALGQGNEIMAGFLELIRERGGNPHEKVVSNYDYPDGYSGAKDPEEQATILREQYQFPLKPLASVKALPIEAEGLWVIPLIQGIVPLQCEHPYNYGVDFVFERLVRNRQFKNWHKDRTGQLYLCQSERTLRLWNQLTLLQGRGELTPVVPAQFGKKHRGESVDYAREDVLDNEILFGAYHVGIMLLTHPEREQMWEQLHIDCAGDECRSHADGIWSRAPFLSFDDGRLHFSASWSCLAVARYGSASGFLLS